MKAYKHRGAYQSFDLASANENIIIEGPLKIYKFYVFKINCIIWSFLYNIFVGTCSIMECSPSVTHGKRSRVLSCI